MKNALHGVLKTARFFAFLRPHLLKPLSLFLGLMEGMLTG